jgi:biopolymer transport protein ExbD
VKERVLLKKSIRIILIISIVLVLVTAFWVLKLFSSYNTELLLDTVKDVNNTDAPSKVENILRFGSNVDVNQKDSNGKNALQYCIESDSDNKWVIASILIKYGADVNVKDVGENTPLMNSIRREDLEMADLLMDNGADFNILRLLVFEVGTYSVAGFNEFSAK